MDGDKGIARLCRERKHWPSKKTIFNWIKKHDEFSACLYMQIAFCAPKDPVQTAENCRQIALKLDWLSRYQDRSACTKNLDGLQTYIASQYILDRRYNEAETILKTVVYRINFAIDTNCYGQDDMITLVQSLGKIIATL